MDVKSLLRRRFARRNSSRQNAHKRLIRSLIGLGGSLTLLLSMLLLVGALAYASITSGLPSLDLLPKMLNPVNGSLLQPTRIYDRNGGQVLMVLAPWDAARIYAPYDATHANHIPETLVRATVALVDPGFWTQPGNRLESLGNPDDHRGLAQSLVFRLFLWNEPAGWQRAIREQILAAQLTSRYGREQVMEWYLNTSNYGHLAYGAEAAARLYFGKPLPDLNLAEAVLLVTVSQSPAINPLDAPEAALQHEQQALSEMQARGLATAAEVEQALQTHLVFKPAPVPPPESFPGFTSLALAQLENHFNRERVELGGLQILTTLDFELQSHASCALQTQLTRLSNPGENLPQTCAGAESLPPLPPAVANPSAQTASAVVLDPHNGQVLALIGDSKAGGEEAAYLSPHRPGSLLTPFVYLTAFTRGLSPASLLWDLPPKNPDATVPLSAYKGPMRLRTALTTDNLGIAGQVFNQMGAGLVQQTMSPFGLDIPASSLKDYLDSSRHISIVQIAQTYGIFASLGTLNGQNSPEGLEPFTLLAVRSLDGQTIRDWSSPASAQVLSPQLAYLLTDVLSANFSDVNYPAAFKAGSSLDAAESWAAGYTPRRVAIVWMGGNSSGTTSFSRSATEGLWTAIMQSASRGLTPDDWTQPTGMLRLKVCDPSGMLPTDACPNIVDEIFIEGYQPMQSDSLYQKYAVNRETNLLATVFTPPQLVEQRVYMLLPPEAASWAATTNLRTPNAPYDYFQPPTQYDNIQPPAPDPNAMISFPAMFAELQGTLTLRGTAGGLDFSYYRLQYGQGLNPQAWTQIGQDSQTPVGNGPLADWDTSGLKGLYSVQLLVVKKDHSLQTATVQVSLNNP